MIVDKLLDAGFQPVNLKAGNVKVGDNIVNRSGIFGTLQEIDGSRYAVHFDMDYADEPATIFTADEFESFFLVDAR
jgi:hypothetical protein